MGKKVPEVADEIFMTLLRLPATSDALLEALVVGFERSGSYREARENIALLERARSIPESLLRRIEVAARSNQQVAESQGVVERVEKLVRASKGKA